MAALHPVVAEVLSTGRVLDREGRPVPAHSFIPESECRLIDRMIERAEAANAIEVGMACGISSVVIADAISKVAAKKHVTPRLVGIDPHQNAVGGWTGIGLLQIARAGFRDILEFHERASQEVLPELVAAGKRFRFAFIDGWHTFDHCLADFFYLDRLLEMGGIVVFDDVGYPAIRQVVRFVLANRSYELVDLASAPPPPAGSVLKVKRCVKRLLRPLTRTDRDPHPRHARLFDRVENTQAVALMKRDDDHRRFDHFSPF